MASTGFNGHHELFIRETYFFALFGLLPIQVSRADVVLSDWRRRRLKPLYWLTPMPITCSNEHMQMTNPPLPTLVFTVVSLLT